MNKHVQLLELLGEKGLSLGSAESLTAGMFASNVCDIPGASNVFKGAIVAYDPAMKMRLLGVKQATLDTHGVVSHQVAAEMARGGAKALGVDICVSCTGNAGPCVQEGGEPVGRVFVGVYYEGNTWTIPLQLNGDRNAIRAQTVDAMVGLVLSLFPEIKNN